MSDLRHREPGGSIRPAEAAKACATLALLTLLIAAACGGEEKGGRRAAVAVAKPTPAEGSQPLAYAQVSMLRLGTPRARVVAQIGPPLRRQKVKPYGVVATCFRYGAVDAATGQVDPRFEFRLCYDRRDRLSLKSTAPPS